MFKIGWSYEIYQKQGYTRLAVTRKPRFSSSHLNK